MAITTQQQSNIIALTVGMFNAAPGAQYLTEFANIFENNGQSYQALADALASTNQYQSQFNGIVTSDGRIDKVLSNLGIQSGTDAYTTAKAHFEARIAEGATETELVVESLEYLLGDDTATEFADVKAQLENKVEVATFYSVEQQQSADNLDDLQGVVSSVTADDATVEAAKNDISNSTGQTFTLTANATADTFVGGSGSDTFNAAAGTLQNNDTLVGGAGNDTLNTTLVAGGAVQPNLDSVETVNATTAANGGTINLVSSTGVQTVNATGNGAFGLTNVNLATTNSFAMNGLTNTMTVAAASLAGTAAANTAAPETANLNVSGATFGTGANAQSNFVISGAGALETLNITSSGDTANTFALGTAGGATLGTVNVAGAQDATIRVASADISGRTINATENTGNVELSIDREGALVASTNLTNVSGVDALTFRDSTPGADALVATNIAAGVSVTAASSFAINSTLSVFGAGTATDNALSLTLDNATANAGVTLAGLDVQNVETLNLVSNGNSGVTLASGNGNSATLTGDYSAINLTGDTATTINYTRDAVATTGTSNASIDASGLEAAASITAIAGGGAATETFTITGSANNDIIVGGAEGNTIDGGAGNDTITGGAGNDTINGGAGNDRINATLGTDTYQGGEGTDTFVFSDAVATDTGAANVALINGFDAGTGGDVIQFATATVGAASYYEGSAAGLTAATDYSTIVLTDQAYASANAAEDAIAAVSTSANPAAVFFLNSTTGFVEAFVDADTGADAVIADGAVFAQFQDVTTLTGLAEFDAANFTVA